MNPATDRQIVNVSPSTKHRSILSSYLLNAHRGQSAVSSMIMEDLRSFMDLGAMQRAMDLVIVLKLFLSEYPDVESAIYRVEKTR